MKHIAGSVTGIFYYYYRGPNARQLTWIIGNPKVFLIEMPFSFMNAPKSIAAFVSEKSQ